MGDNIEIPVPDAPTVNTVVEKPEQAMEHVVQHENRLTNIENAIPQHIEHINAQIADVESRLGQAIENSRTEQAAMLNDRLAVLDDIKQKLEAQAIEAPPEVIADIQDAPTDAVQLVPEVEKTPGAPTNTYKGSRERRKARHGKQA